MTIIGQVVGYDDYDLWGFILAGRSMSTGASTVPGAAKNKFTGKEWDDEFGLAWNYFGARYYDPEIGRWLSVDPLGNQYPFYSPYIYAGNNPLNVIDPNGLEIVGNKDSLETLAGEINQGLQEQGVENASVVVKSRKKSWLKRLFSSEDNEYYLATEGEGWKTIAEAGEGLTELGLTSGQVMGLNWLSDLLRSPTKFSLRMEPHSRHAIKLHTGGGLHDNVVFLDSDYRDRISYSRFSVFMHEFVGHGHPSSPNAPQSNPMSQGANIIGKAFGQTSFHGHRSIFNPNKPTGGYLGYPVILPPTLVPIGPYKVNK